MIRKKKNKKKRWTQPPSPILTEINTRSASLMASSILVEKKRFFPRQDSTTSCNPGWKRSRKKPVEINAVRRATNSMPKQNIISDTERFSFFPLSVQHVFSLADVKLLKTIHTVKKVKLFLIQKTYNAVLKLSATLNCLFAQPNFSFQLFLCSVLPPQEAI